MSWPFRIISETAGQVLHRIRSRPLPAFGIWAAGCGRNSPGSQAAAFFEPLLCSIPSETDHPHLQRKTRDTSGTSARLYLAIPRRRDRMKGDCPSSSEPSDEYGQEPTSAPRPIDKLPLRLRSTERRWWLMHSKVAVFPGFCRILARALVNERPPESG
jgi:hypothetical protein